MARTVIHDEQENAKWGEEDHLQVAQSRSFASNIFELLSEKVPSESELKIFELILNISIDHGPDTPSAKVVIEEAKKGETISEAVAEGIEQINDSHGGAQEKLMEILYSIDNGQLTVDNLVKEKIEEGERVPGFGHRIYKQSLLADAGKDADPRAQLIFDKMIEQGFSNKFIKIAREIRDELFIQSGKSLTVNIDGAIAVALCSFGWDPKLGKAVFIIARTPGLCGQYLNNA